MGSRFRAERKQAQRRVVETGGSGRFPRWTGDPIPEEKGDNRVQNSGVVQSKNCKWGRGVRTRTVNGNEISIKQLTKVGWVLV